MPNKQLMDMLGIMVSSSYNYTSLTAPLFAAPVSAAIRTARPRAIPRSPRTALATPPSVQVVTLSATIARRTIISAVEVRGSLFVGSVARLLPCPVAVFDDGRRRQRFIWSCTEGMAWTGNMGRETSNSRTINSMLYYQTHK